MSADQFLTLDGRPTVRVERTYPHPIEKVWRAVTTPSISPSGSRARSSIDLRPGGPMRFDAFAGDAGAVGVVEVVDAPRRLIFTWGTDRLTFELTPDGDGTTFSLVHSFDDRYGAASFATGWELCLTGLRSVLAGDPLPPPERGVARHEELVHEFGLDRPEVTETDGRWTVRVERQLTCPGRGRVGPVVRQGPRHRRATLGARVGEPLTPYMAPDVVIGTMTEVELHRVFAFDVAPTTGGPGEHLRLEFADGTGHGVRVILTVTGTDPGERDAAAQMWGTGAIGHLAASAAEWAAAQPVEA